MINKSSGDLNTGEQKPQDAKLRRRGRLKVFLSYAPGTGKTLAMLNDAYRRKLQGIDMVVGFVDAQGDQLAEQLLEKMESLPNFVDRASNWSYQALNLDAILARRPTLVLVDHLAQSNPPGVRHEKRYLEVEELLVAGINVFTTVNVYQIESQTDSVAYLTGASVHESVPDHLLDQADEIEMVDLPPQDLLERVAAGQVRVPPRVEALLETFFQPANLFALRELAMRYVARRSNEKMRSYLAGQGVVDSEPASPHLLVCISPRHSSSRLVRTGRRMADETRADWTVIYVETPDQLELSPEEQIILSGHLRMADLLGAKTETVTGRSVAEAVRDYARKHHIQRIVVGRSSGKGRFNPFRQSLADHLLRLEPALSVYVVGSDQTPRRIRVPYPWQDVKLVQILASLGLVAAPTLLGLLLSPFVISRSANLIMLYLLSIVIASVSLGLIPAMLTTVLSVLAFNYLFIPPLYRLLGFAPEYALTFLGLLAVSIIISTLVSRERALTRSTQRRAEQVTRLYELSRDLASAVDLPGILDTIIQHVSHTFDREAVILLAEKKQLLLSASSSGRSLDTSELTAAEWAFQQGRPAGASTGTFSYAAFRYFPLQTGQGTVGVLGVKFQNPDVDLHPEQMRLLGAFVTKAAVSIERGLFAEQASQAEILRATEKLQSALLNSISHDLRTPLASITGVLSSLRLEDDFIEPDTRRELVDTAYDEAERLNRLVGNLLDMSRLESGSLKTLLQPCDIQDVVGSALNSLASRLDDHPVDVQIAPDLPLVPLDFVLIAQVLINLLENAVKYSPEGGPIAVGAREIDHEWVEITVSDRGPGIPEEDLERVFEKFYRVKRFENVVGTGLGLSICKGVVEVHGGTITAENLPGSGVSFRFTLPLTPNSLEFREPVVTPISGDNGHNE